MVNYSMASFIMAEDNNLSALECMAKSKKLVDGNRGEIFVIYLCYFLVSLIVLIIFGAVGIAIRFYTNAPVWVPIVIMGIAFLFVLIVFIIPYFELMLTNAYIELKKAKEPPKNEWEQILIKKTNKSSGTKTTTRKTIKKVLN